MTPTATNTHRPRRGARRTRWYAAVSLAAVVGLAACGDDTTRPAATTPTTNPASGSDPTRTVVEIVAGVRGDTDQTRATLTCNPDGTAEGTGYLADVAGEACALIGTEAAVAAFAPVGDDVACTEEYGGDDVARLEITTVDGTTVVELNRTNGCEIDRWNALQGILPAPVGVEVPTGDAAVDPAGRIAPADTTVIVSAGVQGDPEQQLVRLTCGEDGTVEGTGYLADTAAEACAVLADEATQAAFAPVADDAICTAQYGGDDVATVTVQRDDTVTVAELNRSNGCEIARWDALQTLLPAPQGNLG